jgi:hypothetical protein
MPLPWLGRVRDAGPFHDHPDADAGIVDVPGDVPIVDKFAGESGHAPMIPPNQAGREAASTRGVAIADRYKRFSFTIA